MLAQDIRFHSCGSHASGRGHPLNIGVPGEEMAR